MVARLGLVPQLAPAVSLLYGAHLAGEPGAAPIDVARVLGRRWDDALGVGELAARGAAEYRDSRVRIAPAVQRALDGLAPRAGVLVGESGEPRLLGPCVVAAREPALGVVAEACLASVGGAILAADPGVELADLLLEARAFGAAAMVRGGDVALDRVPGDVPIVIVVDDDAAADRTGLPRLA
jgi:hypothetical protein